MPFFIMNEDLLSVLTPRRRGPPNTLAHVGGIMANSHIKGKAYPQGFPAISG